MVFRATDRFWLVFMPSVFQVWIYDGTKPTSVNPQASKTAIKDNNIYI